MMGRFMKLAALAGIGAFAWRKFRNRKAGNDTYANSSFGSSGSARNPSSFGSERRAGTAESTTGGTGYGATAGTPGGAAAGVSGGSSYGTAGSSSSYSTGAGSGAGTGSLAGSGTSGMTGGGSVGSSSIRTDPGASVNQTPRR